MIVASVSPLAGRSLAAAQTATVASGNNSAADSTLLTISRNGKMTLRLDGRTRSIRGSQLSAMLVKAGHPEHRKVSIRADKNTQYGVVQNAMDRLQQAGVVHVAIVSPTSR